MKRLVIKVGTSTLTTPEGHLDKPYITDLADAIARQHRHGLEIVLVSSGAVGTGVDRLKIERPRTIARKQAAAAVGQGILMGVYATSFEACGLTSAQILLTRQDVADRARYTNAHNTFEALFHYGVIPIVNENDSVAVEEIRFGDNDRLAAMVTLITDADMLIILSDVNGLYDPELAGMATISVVSEVTNAVEALARPTRTETGTGGMVTKLAAARIVTRAGIPMLIASGCDTGIIANSIKRWNALENGHPDPGVPGTLFLPGRQRLQGRKRWIAFGNRVRGILVINDKACAALTESGSSLLAAGVAEVSGRFVAGDLVRILSSGGKDVGRGLINYSLEEMRLICGHRSCEIPELLGRKILAEVIHRDNLVLDL